MVTGSIADLFATLGLDAGKFYSTLNQAQKSFVSAADVMNLSVADIENALQRVPASVGKINASVEVAMRLIELYGTKGEFSAQRIAHGADVIRQAVEKVAVSQRIAGEIRNEIGVELEAALKRETLAQKDYERQTIQALATEAARVKQVAAEKKAAELDYANLKKQLTAEMMAAERQRQQRELVQGRETATILKSIKRDETKFAETMEDERTTDLRMHARIREGIARQVAANETASRRAQRVQDLAEGAVHSQVMRGLFLSSWMVGGRAGFLVGLAGMGGPVTIGTAAVVVGMGAAVKATVEFDNILTQATSNMRGLTDDMKDRLGAMALELSKTFGISAVTIAEGFRDMVESGYDANQTLQQMPIFAKFAFATNTTLAQSIEHITSVQKAFKLESSETERVANLLAAAESEGGESAQQFAVALSAAGSQAEKMGFSIEEAAAAVAILGLKNYDGSRAGEILAQVMGRLQASSVSHRRGWDALGLSMTNADGTAKTLAQILPELQAKLGSTDQAANAAAGKMLGLETRTSKFLALIQSEGVRIESMTSSLQDVSTVMDEIISKRLDSTATQWDILIARATAYAIVLSGPVNDALDTVIRNTNTQLQSIEDLIDRDIKAWQKLIDLATNKGAKPAPAWASNLQFPETPAAPGTSDADKFNTAMDFFRGQGAQPAAPEWGTLQLQALEDARRRFQAEKNNLEILAEQWAVVQLGYKQGKVSEAEYAAMRLGHERELKRIRQESADKAADLAFRLSALTRDLAEKDIAAYQKGTDINERARAAHIAATEKQIKQDEDFEMRAAAIIKNHTDAEGIILDKKLAKQAELADRTAELQDQALDGQVNKYTLAMARIDAEAERSFNRLWKLYGEDEENWTKLQEAKAAIDDIAAQKRKQVVEAYGRQLQSIFHEVTDDLEGFSDFFSRLTDQLANYFEDAVFRMVAAWLLGQQQMIGASQQSGGMGGIGGLLMGLLGPLVGAVAGASFGPTPILGSPADTLPLLTSATTRMFAAGGIMGPEGGIVGEHGPERFVPGVRGTIIPNSELGSSTTVTNYIDARGTDPLTMRRATQVLEDVQRKATANAVVTTREMQLRGSSG